jgi:hypothetical protein
MLDAEAALRRRNFRALSPNATLAPRGAGAPRDARAAGGDAGAGPLAWLDRHWHPSLSCAVKVCPIGTAST